MKPILIEKPQKTSSNVIPQEFLGGDYCDGDVLVRIMSDNQLVRITSTNTQTVRDGLSSYFSRHQQDVGLLCSVIYWQKRTIDYQALHTAFLLDSLSEEDFEREAEKFSTRQVELKPEVIASVVEQLDSLIGLKFDTSDFADFFHCSQSNVLAGLALLNSPHYVALLPPPDQDD